MENRLAENIREHRRRMGLTQDQLAERLGITLGTVSKWERGSSEPDLGYIMDLAELFCVSVDALIGFSMRDANADDEAARIEEMANGAPFEEIQAECESALKRFPNHFRIVFCAAAFYARSGTLRKNEKHTGRALELYRHAIELLSQNKDPEISEVFIKNEIAACYCELKEYKKAVEEYKANNPSGGNNARIGLALVQDLKNPEEGIGYLEKAFIGNASEFATVMVGYIRYYMAVGDAARGIRAAGWAIEHLARAKEDPGKRSFLDKIISVFYLYRALFRDSAGEIDDAETDLREAVRTARAFDASPVYTLENMAFMEHFPKTAYIYDDGGPTALDALRAALDETGSLVREAFREKFERAAG